MTLLLAAYGLTSGVSSAAEPWEQADKYVSPANHCSVAQCESQIQAQVLNCNHTATVPEDCLSGPPAIAFEGASASSASAATKDIVSDVISPKSATEAECQGEETCVGDAQASSDADSDTDAGTDEPSGTSTVSDSEAANSTAEADAEGPATPKAPTVVGPAPAPAPDTKLVAPPTTDEPGDSDDAPGTAGDAGDDGTTTVPPPPTGASGTTGTSGVAGTSGVSGTTGTSGVSGTSGTSGITGTTGAAGTTGTTGTSGVQGASGAQGIVAIAPPSPTNATEPPLAPAGEFAPDPTKALMSHIGTTAVSSNSGGQIVLQPSDVPPPPVTFIGTTASGVAGYSGVSGISGVAGVSGALGAAGAAGATGTTGVAGISNISSIEVGAPTSSAPAPSYSNITPAQGSSGSCFGGTFDPNTGEVTGSNC